MWSRLDLAWSAWSKRAFGYLARNAASSTDETTGGTDSGTKDLLTIRYSTK
jgi:hypothetical protein